MLGLVAVFVGLCVFVLCAFVVVVRVMCLFVVVCMLACSFLFAFLFGAWCTCMSVGLFACC